MSERNDGGSAFPCPGQKVNFGDGWLPQEYGMPLRDYFAAAALHSIMPWDHSGNNDRLPQYVENIARLSYEIADAMLAERAK